MNAVFQLHPDRLYAAQLHNRGHGFVTDMRTVKETGAALYPSPSAKPEAPPFHHSSSDDTGLRSAAAGRSGQANVRHTAPNSRTKR